MTEVLPIPDGIRWVKAVCRLGRLVADTPDDNDRHPNAVPVSGKVKISLAPERVIWREADGRWRSVGIPDQEHSIRAVDGELIDPDGQVGFYFPDPTSPNVEPQGFTVTFRVEPENGPSWSVTVGGLLELPAEIDLVRMASVAASPGVSDLGGRVATLEAFLGGGGTGIELVSGTVTLSGSGAPIREFYTTGAATIGGVSFAAGTAVVFRRAPDGQWGYKAVDGWAPITSDPDPDPDPDPGPDPITVTATAPLWTDNTTEGGGSWTTPTITGVTYDPASGTATPGQTVTVTATAQSGYQLSGTSSWQHTFPTAGPVVPLTVTHTANGAAQAGSDTLTWEEMDIGAASATRRVAVTFSAYGTGTTGLTDVDGSLAMTIGGVTATRDVQGWGASNVSRMTAIFSAVVPTGTTADVTVTYTGSIPNANISVWTIDGAPSAFHGPEDRRYNNNTNKGVSLTVPTAIGSASIFAAYSVAIGQSFTWSYADAAPTVSTTSPAMTITSASLQGTSTGTHTASVICSGINIFGAGGTWVPA